ncbi:hypothetical protein SCUCBS95973_005951 [Sporothrix curviconia]|uniref:U-box domain-containing protein n=1 Tax=Sporothrix curviconia TaxID=1260050 RepID=A0ABP0C1E1_9PEZI
MAGNSIALKEEGNRRFQRGDFTAAEALYSQAILADPKNPALYTNRALARLRLELWDGVVADCTACLDRSPDNMKAHYYLSQAELQLRDYDNAVDHCRRAHALCVALDDKSLTQITSHMLECKRARWADKEKRRAREVAPLEAELVELLEEKKQKAVAEAVAEAAAEGGGNGDGDGDETVKAEIAAEYDAKISTLRELVTLARGATSETARRKVPDWAIDDITFGILVDPVVTKTGKSYERAAIMEHLRRQKTDPLTREPLTVADLRPNLGLQAACEEFLDENGWAVDW